MKLPFPEICFDNATQALALIAKAQEGGDFVVDFSAVERVDSAAISLILEAERRAEAQKEKVLLLHVPRSFLKLRALYGLSDIIDPQQR